MSAKKTETKHTASPTSHAKHPAHEAKTHKSEAKAEVSEEKTEAPPENPLPVVLKHPTKEELDVLVNRIPELRRLRQAAYDALRAKHRANELAAHHDGLLAEYQQHFGAIDFSKGWSAEEELKKLGVG